MEPLQGEGGITPATREFFAAARELCDEHDALLMADEVQTGMGRTGNMWGYMHHGVEVPSPHPLGALCPAPPRAQPSWSACARRALTLPHRVLTLPRACTTARSRRARLWQVDVLTTAKALGGGVPIGAMLCKERANVFAPGDHASTYGGNPLACAAGNAVMTAFEEDDLLQRVRARGEQLRKGLEALQASTGVISEVRARAWPAVRRSPAAAMGWL